MVSVIQSGDTLHVRIRFELKRDLKKPEIAVGTHRTDFVYLTASSTATLKDQPDYPAGQHEIEYIVSTFPFVSGTYCIRFAILDQHRRAIYYGETLKLFSVLPLANEAKQAELRMLDLPTKWKLDGQSYRPQPVKNTFTAS